MQLILSIILYVLTTSSPTFVGKQAVPEKIFITGAEQYKVIELIDNKRSTFYAYTLTYSWKSGAASRKSLFFYHIDTAGATPFATISKKEYSALSKTTIPELAEMLKTHYDDIVNHKHLFLVLIRKSMYEVIPVQMARTIVDE